MSPNNHHALETILFLQGESTSYKKIQTLLGISSEALANAKTELQTALIESGSALTVIDNGESLQLAVRSEYDSVAQKLLKTEYTDELTDTQLEVLTIVAYRGPVTRPVIDSIRGVNSSYTLRNLLVRGLVERTGNQEDARGYIYRISNDFLASLNMETLEDLPGYETLSQDPRLQETQLTGYEE